MSSDQHMKGQPCWFRGPGRLETSHDMNELRRELFTLPTEVESDQVTSRTRFQPGVPNVRIVDRSGSGPPLLVRMVHNKNVKSTMTI